MSDFNSNDIGESKTDNAEEDGEKEKAQMIKVSDATTSQIEAMRYLHEHAYKRILWYRAEIWRISTPLWMGFGALLISAWGAARFAPEHKLIVALSIFIFGQFLIVGYKKYLQPLFEASKYCNDIVSRREKTICKMIGLDQLDGYKVTGHINDSHGSIKQELCDQYQDKKSCCIDGCSGDCDYEIWKRTKPSLVVILIVISEMILIAACLAVLTIEKPRVEGAGTEKVKMMTTPHSSSETKPQKEVVPVAR